MGKGGTAIMQYGDLVKAKADLEVRIHVLRKQASDLEERQKSKQEVEKHLAVLSSEKADLEKSIGGLSKERETLTQVKSDVGSLTEQKSLLKVDIDSMRKTKEELCIEIEELTKRTSDLQELDTRRNDLLSSLTTIETEISSHKSQMNILNSFLGFIAPSSMSDVEKFVTLLPALLDEAKHKNHSPDILRNIILQTLTGGKLRSLRCTSCKTKFIVNKPSEYGLGYHCPTCWSTLVEVAHDETEILERAMIGPKPQILRVKHSTK